MWWKQKFYNLAARSVSIFVVQLRGKQAVIILVNLTGWPCLQWLSILSLPCATLLSLCIHAGSPNVTSLTYNDQSMTLTCISTGGPATTVTWRKNGDVIALSATHQQTKSLVDPVAGTYRTVLTIDPSVDLRNIVGTYNCTVENDRGESSEEVVVPGETCPFAPWYVYIHPML